MELLKVITFHECKFGTRFVIFPYAKCAGIGWLERAVRGWSPHQLGISARHRLGFGARHAHLQHRNLGPRLYFQWCHSQFWGHKEKSENSSIIYFLTWSFIALLWRPLWYIRLTTLETSSFQVDLTASFSLAEVAYKMIPFGLVRPGYNRGSSVAWEAAWHRRRFLH